MRKRSEPCIALLKLFYNIHAKAIQLWFKWTCEQVPRIITYWLFQLEYNGHRYWVIQETHTVRNVRWLLQFQLFFTFYNVFLWNLMPCKRHSWTLSNVHSKRILNLWYILWRCMILVRRNFMLSWRSLQRRVWIKERSPVSHSDPTEFQNLWHRNYGMLMEGKWKGAKRFFKSIYTRVKKNNYSCWILAFTHICWVSVRLKTDTLHCYIDIVSYDCLQSPFTVTWLTLKLIVPALCCFLNVHVNCCI